MNDGVKVAICFLIVLNVAFLLACDFSEKPYCLPWDNCSHKRYVAAQEKYLAAQRDVDRHKQDLEDFKKVFSEVVSSHVKHKLSDYE